MRLTLAFALLLLAAPQVVATIVPSSYEIAGVRQSDGARFEGRAWAVERDGAWHGQLWLFSLDGGDERQHSIPIDRTLDVRETPSGRVTLESWTSIEGSFRALWTERVLVEDPTTGGPSQAVPPEAGGEGRLSSLRFVVTGHT